METIQERREGALAAPGNGPKGGARHNLPADVSVLYRKLGEGCGHRIFEFLILNIRAVLAANGDAALITGDAVAKRIVPLANFLLQRSLTGPFGQAAGTVPAHGIRRLIADHVGIGVAAAQRGVELRHLLPEGKAQFLLDVVLLVLLEPAGPYQPPGGHADDFLGARVEQFVVVDVAALGGCGVLVGFALMHGHNPLGLRRSPGTPSGHKKTEAAEIRQCTGGIPGYLRSWVGRSVITGWVVVGSDGVQRLFNLKTDGETILDDDFTDETVADGVELVEEVRLAVFQGEGIVAGHSPGRVPAFLLKTLHLAAGGNGHRDAVPQFQVFDGAKADAVDMRQEIFVRQRDVG